MIVLPGLKWGRTTREGGVPRDSHPSSPCRRHSPRGVKTHQRSPGTRRVRMSGPRPPHARCWGAAPRLSCSDRPGGLGTVLGGAACTLPATDRRRKGGARQGVKQTFALWRTPPGRTSAERRNASWTAGRACCWAVGSGCPCRTPREDCVPSRRARRRRHSPAVPELLAPRCERRVSALGAGRAHLDVRARGRARGRGRERARLAPRPALGAGPRA